MAARELPEGPAAGQFVVPGVEQEIAVFGVRHRVARQPKCRQAEAVARAFLFDP
jgi:hypothetical protein